MHETRQPQTLPLLPADAAPFEVVGRRRTEETPAAPPRRNRSRCPWGSALVLAAILLGCLLADVIAVRSPALLDLMHCTEAPGREFWFGTDTLGRDLFACIWHGGRISLGIGFLATALSTAIAVLVGTVSGLAAPWADALLMRLVEILLSVPGLLVILFLQAVLGKPTVLSLAAVIGVSGWYSIAKVVRTEVRRLRSSEYVLAARCMGGGFWYILRRHLAPNFFPAILFMVVMNVRSAIVAESTLSFLGMGLPLEVVSWGSMLSLSERALMTGAWWIILIPGLFLVALLVCLTDLGNWLRQEGTQRESNL